MQHEKNSCEFFSFCYTFLKIFKSFVEISLKVSILLVYRYVQVYSFDMLLDNDVQVQIKTQKTLAQRANIEQAAALIKMYAEKNYVSQLNMRVYNYKDKKYTQLLGRINISPKVHMFIVGQDTYYTAKDQEGVLQWLIERVRYYSERYNY